MTHSISSKVYPYAQRMGTSNPGLIMILLDQSSSMKGKKAEFAANAVNDVINEIRLASRNQGLILNRCYVGVIGYGKSVKAVVGGKIPDVANSLKLTKQIRDGEEVEVPIWVEPEAENGTPMAEALDKACQLISQWVKTHQDSFPPVVINITDGAPNGFDNLTGEAKATTSAAENLMKLATSDGQLLLFNAHITESLEMGRLVLPNDMSVMPNKYAKLLFNMSSVLPESLMREAHRHGFSPKEGARGLVFNADADTLIKLLVFGSTRAR